MQPFIQQKASRIVIIHFVTDYSLWIYILFSFFYKYRNKVIQFSSISHLPQSNRFQSHMIQTHNINHKFQPKESNLIKMIEISSMNRQADVLKRHIKS